MHATQTQFTLKVHTLYHNVFFEEGEEEVSFYVGFLVSSSIIT